MVGEAPGPVNFTQMVMLFAEKMAGGILLLTFYNSDHDFNLVLIYQVLTMMTQS